MRNPPEAPFWLRSPWFFAAAWGVAAVATLLLAGSPLQRLDREWADATLRMRLKLGLAPKPSAEVFLIGIEKEDLEGLSIPAEYRTYAEIQEIANDLGAAAVAYDLIFTRGEKAEAAPIMDSARKARGVVFAEAYLGEREMMRSFPFATPPEFPGGLVNVTPDPDGVHRRYDYAVVVDGRCTPSLALAEFLVARGAIDDLKCGADRTVRWPELGVDQKSLVEKAIPMSVPLLNYRSSFAEPWDKGFKYLNVRDLRSKYSAWKKTQGAVPGDLPGAGSLVLTGLVAAGSGDTGPTPFGLNEPKVEIHAAALSDLLQGQLITGWNAGLEAAEIALLLVCFTLWGLRARSYAGLTLGWAVFTAAPLIAATAALIRMNVYVMSVTPAVVVTLAFLAEAGRRGALASLEKLRIRMTMAMYFSPRVLEEVLRNPGAMAPREAELIVLITDLRNFTTITERYGTPVIFDVMNRVFEIETHAVLSMEGSMEHFLGDQFLGYWGAPSVQPDAAERAMKAGWMIIEGLDALKKTLAPELAALFGFGLAIHRGKALVGNKGSRERFDYGILGDMVNTTARVESLTKLYGARWIVTGDLIEAANGTPHRKLDSVRVKGRAHSVDLVEIAVNPGPEWADMARRYEGALDDYFEGRFPEALEMFVMLSEVYLDRASQVMAERCREMLVAPPAVWDGAYTLKEK